MNPLRILLLLLLTTIFPADSFAQITYVTREVRLKDGTNLRLRMPLGYRIAPAMEGMRRLRFLAKSPDGRLFATDMFDKSDNSKGTVYLFEGWDERNKAFKSRKIFASGLRNPNQVAFYSEGGRHYIYIAETHRLTRYLYTSGDTVLRGTPQHLASFPDYGLSYKYGGWHLTRSIAFNKGKVYVSVGSSCNACIEKENIRASIIEMNPDGSGQQVFATGLRNSVGIRWANGNLWTTGMGRDLIGPDKPEDLFHIVERGKFYGWPFYFQYRGKVYPDLALMDSAVKYKAKVPLRPSPVKTGFQAHVAPLGFDYFSGFRDPLLRNRFLVALHGSTSVWRQRGNALVLVNEQGRYFPFIDGFLEGKTESGRKGRPCDVLMNDDHSFFFTDDHKGVLYYVWKE
ncbi:MAG: glucose/sorbosone dehydrogenase [Sphingobacteriales bacterium]|nr:MAG: glucose/sorbosone dehydrogenase [Sphingobacteriales bacterium]